MSKSFSDPENRKTYPILDAKEIQNADQELAGIMAHPPVALTLLTNKFNGIAVEALFTSYEKAFLYLYRICVNNCVETYQDHPAELDSDGKQIGFLDYVKDMANECYELIYVIHLDPNLPIYIKQDRLRGVDGSPSQYITNSVLHWKKNQPDGMTSDEWLEECTISIDPPLPDLELTRPNYE